MDYNLTDLLEYVNPAACNYQSWVNVGMALKEAGYTASAWDAWSARDRARYHPGECVRKWESFRGAATPVTAGTIVQMAKDGGWTPDRSGYELAWDGVIGGKDELAVVDPAWLEATDVPEPGDEWNPCQQLIKYLDTLFDADDYVGYVTEVWNKDDRWLPTKGC